MNASMGASTSRGMFWAGSGIGVLAALLLVLDAVMKLIKPAFVVKATTDLGYPENVIVPLGIVLLISTLLYLFPWTSVLGAILLTGYLGGAVASHVRLNQGWFEILMPVVFGVLLWGGLWLRDARVRRIVPWHG